MVKKKRMTDQLHCHFRLVVPSVVTSNTFISKQDFGYIISPTAQVILLLPLSFGYSDHCPGSTHCQARRKVDLNFFTFKISRPLLSTVILSVSPSEWHGFHMADGGMERLYRTVTVGQSQQTPCSTAAW